MGKKNKKNKKTMAAMEIEQFEMEAPNSLVSKKEMQLAVRTLEGSIYAINSLDWHNGSENLKTGTGDESLDFDKWDDLLVACKLALASLKVSAAFGSASTLSEDPSLAILMSFIEKT